MKVLLTGGLGFIGVNTALQFYKKGHEIYIIDNFSRRGNLENFNTLKKNCKFTIWNKDVRNFFDLEEIFKNHNFDAVIHLAAQVAVTSSVRNPREDFEINALGTFNILECLRKYQPDSLLIYASTNKVYGDFNMEVISEDKRYKYIDDTYGVSENLNLDFHSPYGVSKGSADQYVRDYNRIYGLNTVVLRQSCIYGPNQFGIEDQGWLSWFTICSLFDKKFTIYGDGKQVRDVLHVDDLIELYERLITNIKTCKGKIYNVGGGKDNSLSLLELTDILKNKLNKNINFEFSDWRPGDQKIYISDIGLIEKDLGWSPKISHKNGISSMIGWLSTKKEVLKDLDLI